jgi:hypothetical protein
MTNETNLLNGMRVIAQTDDAVYLRIPKELQVESDFAGGQCSCGHCDGSGKWDTLVVPTHGNYQFSATVHMPDSSVQPFLASIERAKRKGDLVALINTYNEASSPSVPRTDEEHEVEKKRAKIALGSIRRNYREGTDYRELSNGALWTVAN